MRDVRIGRIESAGRQRWSGIDAQGAMESVAGFAGVIVLTCGA